MIKVTAAPNASLFCAFVGTNGKRGRRLGVSTESPYFRREHGRASRITRPEKGKTRSQYEHAVERVPTTFFSSRRFSSYQSCVRFCEAEVSITPDRMDTKANLAQVARQVGRSVKLLDVSFLRSPIVLSDLSESGVVAR